MVERVARSIYERARPSADFGVDMASWESAAPSTRSDLRELARTVIAAMREPSQAMVDAGVEAVSDGICDAWYAMIDAALEEPT